MNRVEADRDQNVSAATIEEEIQILEARRHQQVRYTTAAMNRIHGETVSKYWTALNKAKTPRDTILGLRDREGSGRVLKDPTKMASLAQKYHNDIQWEEITPQAPTERKKDIDEALQEVKCKLNPDQVNYISKRLTREEVASALAHAETGKAAGINGIPYELWKELDQQFTNQEEQQACNCFDVILALTMVFNDIEAHGVQEGTDFCLGWMCPIYKKNDREDIANYRPITLLNSDYKIFTKALAIKLSQVAAEILNKDQAGFVKGRSIFNQTKLASAMMHYAEAEEDNGVIVALDQEKAYDKIDHKYLWTTLNKYGFPPEFINVVKALYQDTHTQL
ncbi:hypothetical protein AB1N83_007254 [Pleurotus pulmonarius]